MEVYHNGHWKRICNSDWGIEQANVVCREINCGSPVIQTSYPNLGETSIADGVKTTCTGNETSISQCTIQEFKERCEDAIVLCSSTSVVVGMGVLLGFCAVSDDLSGLVRSRGLD